MSANIEAYPLYWPEDRNRTKYREHSRFKTGFGAARQFLIWEIERMGGSGVIISSNVPLRNDGLPRANQPEPIDPGIAVYFKYQKKDMVFACDKYTYIRDNIYAIGKTIEAMRGIERWGSSDMMERAFRGFAALPEKAEQGWRREFGFHADQIVTREDVQMVFRGLALKYHPDRPGGDAEKFMTVSRARDNAFKDLPA